MDNCTNPSVQRHPFNNRRGDFNHLWDCEAILWSCNDVFIPRSESEEWWRSRKQKRICALSERYGRHLHCHRHHVHHCHHVELIPLPSSVSWHWIFYFLRRRCFEGVPVGETCSQRLDCQDGNYVHHKCLCNDYASVSWLWPSQCCQCWWYLTGCRWPSPALHKDTETFWGSAWIPHIA